MSDVLYRETKYMTAKDALLAREEKLRKRERQEDTRSNKGRNMARTRERREDQRPKPPAGRFTNFTPLTAPIDQVLMQIKDERTLTFPSKLKGDPNKRLMDRYCHFHGDHGHDMADWSSKKARKTYLWMVQSVQLTGSSPKMARLDNLSIEFSEEDTRRLHHPHDDVLVVSIRAGDYNMHRVLVDNGSSVDILYYPAFQQMGIGREQFIPTSAPFIGFRGIRVYPLGVVTLSVTVEDYPEQITKDVVFLVVNYSSAYNAILGWPALNAWKAVTSTYHLMVKCPTEYGVGKLRGNQVVARECYVAMMEMDDQL
ncbi:uncharacterized protein LOC142639603 [Castanea sativa]|uniref:uncharacterized protein LOC142639603 n=1 Tax=Castanea sativa TaxID=21020 RepID=UPI003F64BE28